MTRFSAVSEDLRPFLPVAPRVLSRESGQNLQLVDLLEPLIASGRQLVVRLVGDGKTTAIRYIERHVPSGCIAVEDADIPRQEHDGCPIVLTSELQRPCDVEMQLSGWGDDERIEYLLKNHPSMCNSVMSRLQHSGSSWGSRSPFLWRAVLDCMAQNPDVVSDKEAIWMIFAEYRNQKRLRDLLDRLIDKPPQAAIATLKKEKLLVDLLRMLAIAQVLQLMVARRMLEGIQRRDGSVLNRSWLLPPIVRELGCQVGNDRSVLITLERWSRKRLRASFAASILNAADPHWRPRFRTRVDLSGAELPRAQWAECRLRKVILSNTNLANANLQGSDLRRAGLAHANLNGAEMDAAQMDEVSAYFADFTSAKLNHVHGHGARCYGAKFIGADLSGAEFHAVNFRDADFSQASLAAGDFLKSDFCGAIFEQANLRDASLRAADLSKVDFRTAELQGADFEIALLTRANMEDLDLTGCRFVSAFLVNALLTGSHATGTNFAAASFGGAGLAEIEWQDCDLRRADFSNVAFHLGSTRSGLVGSPYPSHGSRTGFYTDDFDDLHYKQPETIRKAALVNCDLRGAKVHDADFYLVDLRGSRFSADQQRHFAACGAILDRKTNS